MNSPLVIAHRGNSLSAPENTLAAIREAIALGSDCVEVDVRCTKDAVPILMHDPAIGRLTGDMGYVSDLSLEEIRKLDVGSRKDEKYRGEGIPTLEEALLEAKGRTQLVAEVKVDCAEQIQQLVRKLKVEQGLFFAGFRIELLQKLFRTMPNFGVAWVLNAPQWLGANSAKAIELASESEIGVIVPPFPAVSPSSVCCAHEVGLKVWTYEVEPDQFEKTMAAGVDGIITDYLQELLTFLAVRIGRPARSTEAACP